MNKKKIVILTVNIDINNSYNYTYCSYNQL